MEIDIRDYLGFVYNIASKYRNKLVEHEDMVQAGCEGLVMARKRYKKRLGKFTTIAYLYVKGYITKEIRKAYKLKGLPYGDRFGNEFGGNIPFFDNDIGVNHI